MILCQIELLDEGIVLAHETEDGQVFTLRQLTGRMLAAIDEYITSSMVTAIEWGSTGTLLASLPDYWLDVMSLEYMEDDDNLAMTYEPIL